MMITYVIIYFFPENFTHSEYKAIYETDLAREIGPQEGLID
jgi:hypothetical protein